MPDATIGTAARKAGVGVETIRFYERRGLIAQPPKPHGSGFRRYPEHTIQRIRFIRRAQQLGFSLREIDELLLLRANPATTCPDMRSRAASKLDDIEQKIAQLSTIRHELSGVVAACPGTNNVDACPLVATLEGRTG